MLCADESGGADRGGEEAAYRKKSIGIQLRRQNIVIR